MMIMMTFCSLFFFLVENFSNLITIFMKRSGCDQWTLLYLYYNMSEMKKISCWILLFFSLLINIIRLILNDILMIIDCNCNDWNMVFMRGHKMYKNIKELHCLPIYLYIMDRMIFFLVLKIYHLHLHLM